MGHDEHYLKTELYDLVRKDPAVFEFLKAFLGQYPDLIEELEQGCAAGDLTVVGRVAHTIGGSLRLFEGAHVVGLAHQVEEACRFGGADHVPGSWRALHEELGQVLPELNRFLSHDAKGT